MMISAKGLGLLMSREGIRLHAYRDVRRIWTIGVGHTSMAGPPKVWPWSSLTLSQAQGLFAKDVQPYELAVSRTLKRTVTQNQFDACVSLCYNIGPGGFAGSSIAKELNLGHIDVAANDFLLFDHPAELVERRRDERAQFLEGAIA